MRRTDEEGVGSKGETIPHCIRTRCDYQLSYLVPFSHGFICTCMLPYGRPEMIQYQCFYVTLMFLIVFPF